MILVPVFIDTKKPLVHIPQQQKLTRYAKNFLGPLPNLFAFLDSISNEAISTAGIALSGNGIGAIPFGYINEYFVKTFGLMMTFRLLALLAVPLFLGSLIYGPTVVLGKEEKSKEEKPRSIQVKKSSESILKNKALMVHALALSVNAFGYYIPAVHLVSLRYFTFLYFTLVYFFLLCFCLNFV